MKSSDLLILAFLFQGLAMLFDEFYFHRRRGLPKWEKLGHPLDTLSVLVCFYLVLFVGLPISENLVLFATLSIFSCLLITKDEFVHAKECSGGEQWLHSVLFIIHPIALFVLGYIGLQHEKYPEDFAFLWQALKIQFFIMLLFGLYQFVFWNFIEKGGAHRPIDR